MIVSERQMPANVDIECSVLACMMLEKTKQAYMQGASELSAADFSIDSHQKIFIAMADLFESGQEIDPLTVTDKLGEKGQLINCGGADYIMDLPKGQPLIKNIRSYIQIVREKSSLRQLIHMANGAMEAAYDPHGIPVSHTLSLLQDQILSLLGNSNKQNAVKIQEFSDATWKLLCDLRASEHRLVGLTTGIDGLDYRTTGISKGELWTLGGRTGDGKTSFALGVAAANAKVGIPVGYFSIEMNRHRLLNRLWSSEGDIDFKRIRDPKFLDEVDLRRLIQVRERVDSWPLYIEDAANYTIGEIDARSRLGISQHDWKLIIVDYAQLVDAPGRDERLKMSKVAKVLRQLAKGQDVAVLCLSAMPRPKDHDMNKRPTKFDLKESGSLENDSDTVPLIYRPVDDHNQYTGEDEIIVDKQRSGETGIERVVYVGRYMRFESRAL